MDQHTEREGEEDQWRAKALGFRLRDVYRTSRNTRCGILAHSKTDAGDSIEKVLFYNSLIAPSCFTEKGKGGLLFLFWLVKFLKFKEGREREAPPFYPARFLWENVNLIKVLVSAFPIIADPLQ